MPLGGYLMTWILWQAYVSAPKGSAPKLWIASKLEFVSNVMEVEAGRIVIDKIDRTLEDPWDLRSSRFRR